MSSQPIEQLRLLNGKQSIYHDVVSTKLQPIHLKLASNDQSAPCSPKTRDDCVVSILGWAEKWRAGIDTISLAVCLLDLTIAKTRPPNRYAHVCALACLHLAAKIYEEEHMETDTDVYNLREVRRMQLAILKLVDWDLSLPTNARYLIALTSLCAPALADTRATFARAVSILKQAMQRHRIMYKFPPSALALAALSIAVKHEDNVDGMLLYATRQAALTREQLAQAIVALESMLLSLSASASGSCSSITRRVRPGRCARKRRRRINSKGSDLTAPVGKRSPRIRPPTLNVDIVTEGDDGLRSAFDLLYGDLP